MHKNLQLNVLNLYSVYLKNELVVQHFKTDLNDLIIQVIAHIPLLPRFLT